MGRVRYPGFAFLLVLLAGCYEDTGVTLHEAHQYKGKEDRHVGDADRSARLRQRFHRVQTDR